MATSPLGRLLGLGRTRRSRSTSTVLIAASAAAGVALGIFIADRTGGLDGLRRRGKGDRGVRLQAARRSPLATSRDADGSDQYDDLSDADSELSLESIAHMHVRGVGARAAPATRAAFVGRTATDRAREAKPVDIRELPVRRVPNDAALEARVLEAFMNDPILR
ncbi:MAG: hypothetical protein ABIW79_07905, partial [Gemmatimonas sp.]